MIFTYSLLAGLQATLGLFPLRIALFIAALFVPIPKEELTKYSIDSEEITSLWGCQVFFHIWTALLSILSTQIMFWRPLEYFVSQAQVLTMIVMIPLFMW